jgi:hypothetical protein
LAVLAIGDLIEPYAMPIPAGDPMFSARVDIELRDGTHLEHYQAGSRGHPSRPATSADIERKFTGNVVGVLGEASRSRSPSPTSRRPSGPYAGSSTPPGRAIRTPGDGTPPTSWPDFAGRPRGPASSSVGTPARHSTVRK